MGDVDDDFVAMEAPEAAEINAQIAHLQLTKVTYFQDFTIRD